MASHTDRALAGFSAALREHERVTGLEPGITADTRVWHLLVSAIEWCDSRTPRLDFNEILEAARSFYDQER